MVISFFNRVIQDYSFMFFRFFPPNMITKVLISVR